MNESGYFGEWVITVLLGGTAFGTTALLWFKSVMIIKGREPAVRSRQFVEIETYVLASLMILIRSLLILAI